MESLQDKAIIYVPYVEGRDVLAEILADAEEEFGVGACFTSSANGSRIGVLTVYSPRVKRIPFQKFVQSAVGRIGALGYESVTVEINGIGGVYQQGKDYE